VLTFFLNGHAAPEFSLLFLGQKVVGFRFSKFFEINTTWHKVEGWRFISKPERPELS